MKTQLKKRFVKEILSYLSSSDEQLLYVGKPSAATLIPVFSVMFLGFGVIYTLIHYVTLIILNNLVLYMVGVFILTILSVGMSGFLLIDWLFDFYIVTNKKIIDMQYAPPFSHNLSTILMDQVRCTEIDMQKNGAWHELLDFGDVTITFDRPTHQESFVLKNIRHPEQVSLYLGHALTAIKTQTPIEPFWFRRQRTDHKLQIGEDIYPLLP